jgi:hypothetical protein
VLICIADLPSASNSLSGTELGNPAGTSKSIDLEPFRKGIILKGVINPLECAFTSLLSRKSIRMRSYEKDGGWGRKGI